MKVQHLGIAALIIAGLMGSPLVTHAEEEGSSSGQHMQDHQNSHAKDGKGKQTGTTPLAQEGSGTAREPTVAQHDGHGKPAPAKEQGDEGSH